MTSWIQDGGSNAASDQAAKWTGLVKAIAYLTGHDDDDEAGPSAAS